MKTENVKPMLTSDTYCPLPWIHICSNPTGRLILCCEDTLDSEFKGKREFHILEGIDKYKSSPYMQWVREKMLKGEYLKECHVCYKEEAEDLFSKRQHEIQQWEFTTVDKTIQYADLKLGNHCNLKCFMCDPCSSDAIAEEFKKIGWHHRPPFEKGQMGVPIVDCYKQNWNWTDSSVFTQLLSEMIPVLKKLKFTGGEPLLNRQVLECLNKVKRLNKNLNLQITTNGTKLNDHIVSMLNCLNTEVVISLEGVGNVNSFIRYPSRWENIADNLNRLKEFQIKFRINATFNILNMLYLTDLIEYSNHLTKNRLTLIPIHQPDFFNPAIAPLSLKKKVEERLDRWSRITKMTSAGHYRKQITGRLYSSAPNPRLFNKFKYYIFALCSSRGIEIKNYLPELAYEMTRIS